MKIFIQPNNVKGPWKSEVLTHPLGKVLAVMIASLVSCRKPYPTLTDPQISRMRFKLPSSEHKLDHISLSRLEEW